MLRVLQPRSRTRLVSAKSICSPKPSKMAPPASTYKHGHSSAPILHSPLAVAPPNQQRQKTGAFSISYRHRWWISLPFANRHGGHLLREFKIILGRDAEADSWCCYHDRLLRGPQRSANEADQAMVCLNLGGNLAMRPCVIRARRQWLREAATNACSPATS